MPATEEVSVRIAVVTVHATRAAARSTVRSALAASPGAHVHVLDVDGHHVPVADERVLTLSDLDVDVAAVRRRAAASTTARLLSSLQPALVASIGPGDPVLCLLPGVEVTADPRALVDLPDGAALGVVPRTAGPLPDDGLHPDDDDLRRWGGYAPAVVVAHPDGTSALASWAHLADAATDDRWLDVLVATGEAVPVAPAARVVSGWSLRPGGDPLRDAALVDLSELDPCRPWVLRPTLEGDPRGRLSDHPDVAALVARVAAERLEDAELLREVPGPARVSDGDGSRWDASTTSLGIPVDGALRAVFAAARDDRSAPDPFDPAQADALRAWLTDATPDGGPGRYLAAVRAGRADLTAAFPDVPGAGSAALVAWARAHGVAEGYPAVLVAGPSPTAPTEGAPSAAPDDRPARRGRPTPGVNVVGFLTGSLGIGESARLMVEATTTAGLAVQRVDVDATTPGRARVRAGGGAHHDTTVLCVNADLTPVVARAVPQMLRKSYRIGMWYWEVEDFPATLHGAFAHVDEVWTATDFVRSAIEPHSPVPVRTVTPPLPQRGPEPTLSRTDLGLPDRPYHLFVFDHLSTLERKNPLAVIDAFTAAFGPDDGPVLVVKSINAARRPVDAERVRLHAARHPHVVLLEDHLPAAARDALVARCDVYVSLHRSEGLGLTMAEAMAWGKPVVATGYSGNLQFMTAENSFLVPWTEARIPVDAAPYPPGARWAEPDVDAAAVLLRRIAQDPALAAAKGARAAQDIADRHSAGRAGAAVAARLDEVAGARRRRVRRGRVAGVARSAASALPGPLRRG